MRHFGKPHVDVLFFAHFDVDTVVAVLQLTDFRDDLCDLILAVHFGILLRVGHQCPQVIEQVPHPVRNAARGEHKGPLPVRPLPTVGGLGLGASDLGMTPGSRWLLRSVLLSAGAALPFPASLRHGGRGL